MRAILILPALLLGGGAWAQVWEKPVAPGLLYRMEVEASVPRIVHALRFTPGTPELRAVSELAGGTMNEPGTVSGRLTPSKMAQAAGAIAAINADFFSFDHGAPIGLMVRSGELLNTPLRLRATFGWGQDYAFGIGSAKATVVDADRTLIELDHINQPIGNHQIVLYTPAIGELAVNGECVMAVLKTAGRILPNGECTATVDYLIGDKQRLKVEPDRLVLVARGNKARLVTAMRPGQEVRVRTESSAFDWQKIEHAIGGGPFLLRGGVLAIDATEQGFNAAFSNSRHPRSAVGRTASGEIWLVAIDGRQSMSAGATLAETAEIMKRLGCTDAINLDGGGSTALHILGVTVNRPSGQAERPVSNAILLFAPRPQASPLAPVVKLPEAIVLGEPFQVSLEVDGKPVPHEEVLWAAQGSAWIDQAGLVRPFQPGAAQIQAHWRGYVLSTELKVPEKPVPQTGTPRKSGSGRG